MEYRHPGSSGVKKFKTLMRDCRNGSTTASSSASNRPYREYGTSPKLRRYPPVPSPIRSSVSSDEFQYNTFQGSRRDRNYSLKDRNDLSRYYGLTNFVAHQNEDVVNENMVLAVNGVEFPIEGKGDVKIWFNGHKCLTRKKNVFFPSRLRKNLMSGPMLDQKGLKFIGKNGQIKVYAGNKLIFKANLEQGLYHIYPDIEQKFASSIEKAIKIEGKPNDLMTWHERFGHANVDYIPKTSCLEATSKIPPPLFVGTPRPLRGKLDPKAKKGKLFGFAPGTREYRVWILEDSKVIETSNVRFQKPQQSNSGAVLASPGLKFYDYEVVENGDDDDKTVNNIPVSLPKNSDSETEDEELSRTDSFMFPVKTT
ncbi:uncharacterized protein TNCV_3988101 [Trichonephila clavipes]|nr:uncharacterized protein TNCV_3988101 [Trichonephila clavipes]